MTGQRAREPLDAPLGCLSTRTRYLILFLGSACIASICSNMTAINFTIICMGSGIKKFNETTVRGIYDYDNNDKSYIMWAMAFGTLFAAWPFQFLYQRFGARKVFFAAGMISTISTLVLPWAAGTHFYLLLVGISFGADFAAIGLITVHWASLKQHGLFISLLSSFSQISVMFTMPVAGNLCESRFGWPMVYYVHGALSLVLFCLWYYYYRNDPRKHPSMSHIELEKIQRGKGEHDMHEAPPVKKIFRNHVMWVVWLSAFGELMMSQFIVMYGPTYLKEVLGFGVEHTGYWVAIPRAAHLCFKIISGMLSDKITQHAHFVLSAIQFIKCVSLFLEPLLIVLVCRNNTLAEWRIVFLIHGCLLIGGNIAFCFFATDEPADFTYAPQEQELQQKNGKELSQLPPEAKPLKSADEE